MRVKTCLSCKLDRPIDCFHRNRRTSSGLAVYCKECVAANYKFNRNRSEYLKKKQLENHRSKVFSGADIGRLQKLETNAIIRDNTQLGNRRSMDITSMFAATDDELKIKR